MAKVLLNKGYGGFGVSPLAHEMYAKRIGKELFFYVGETATYNNSVVINYRKVSFDEFIKAHRLLYYYLTKDFGDSFIGRFSHDECEKYDLNLDESHREDPILIEIVEEIGEQEASDRYSTLKIVEIPDELANGNYMIDNYEGIETLHAKVVEY